MDSLALVHDEVVACRACPRLVAWREEVARTKRAAYRHETYWGRPVPSFGDPDATLVVIGLAPAAHGANRTGRMFTGDRSGEWLYRALWRAGYANQPESVALDDGMRLTGAWITAPVRCAPPANKPTPDEQLRCRPFIERELALLGRARVYLALGQIGYQATCGLLGVRPRPRFAHGLEVPVPEAPEAPGHRGPDPHHLVLVPREPAEHLHRAPDRAHARCRADPSPPAVGRLTRPADSAGSDV